MATLPVRIRTIADEISQIFRLLTCAREEAAASSTAAHRLADEAQRRIELLRAHLQRGGGMIVEAVAAVPVPAGEPCMAADAPRCEMPAPVSASGRSR